MKGYEDKDCLLDADYIALLQIASVALEVYSLQRSDNQDRQTAYSLRLLERIEEKLNRMEDRVHRIERILEGGIYNG